MMVSDYFATFRINIDRTSVAQVDRTLAQVEAKLKAFGNNTKIKLDLSSFTIKQSSLNLALGNALDIASKSVPFEVSKFVVNDRNLLAALLRAARRLPPLPPGPNPPLPPHPGPHPGPYPPAPGSRAAAAAGGGLIGRGIGGLYGPALALGLGGYGLSELNKRNQEVVAARLQSQAVISGNAEALGITPEQATEKGKDSFEWLRKTANRVGFNYLDAAGDYNVLLSNIIGSGGSVQQGQNIFKGFAEYGRVNKLTPARQKLVFNALSQIAGKDKLQAEELTKQLGNSLPGAKDIFAQAYQKQLKDTGKGKGDLTGSAAIIALEAAMKKGLVRGDILNYAANIASEKAAPGLKLASQASQAQQALYQNSVNDLAVVASDAGVEEGFARIFRTLTAGLNESGDLVKRLAQGFNDVTKWADDLLLFPQSFVRALEGRDSLVADWLGVDKTKGLIKDWNGIKSIWNELTAGASPEWLPTLQATSKELAAVLKQGAEFAQWLKALKDSPNADSPDASMATQPITGTYQTLARIVNGVSEGLSNARIRGQAVYDDPTSPFYKKPELFDANRELNTEYYPNFRAMQNDPEGEALALAVRKAMDVDNIQTQLGNSIAPSGDGLTNLTGIQANQGIFNNYDVTPSGEPFQDLSQYNPQTPEEIADYNKTLAMSQADTAATQQTITNNFDIQLTVDATLAGETVEQQARAMADAASTAVTGALEHVQAQYPTRE